MGALWPDRRPRPEPPAAFEAPGPVTSPRVRPFAEGDVPAVVPILYESSGGLYDRYAGSRALSERALARALRSEGTTASADVVRVAELEGQVAGAMAAMPYSEWTPRARGFLSAMLRSIPPWRWPTAVAVYRAGGRADPEGSASWFYVDSLATAPGFRRRGVGLALLGEAERQARELGLGCVALDTWEDNHAARALYARAGFEEAAYTPRRPGFPGGVSLVKEVGP